jgi:hypothetical protein
VGRYAGWDDATHDRVGAVAHHLGEVLADQPGATWTLGDAGTVDEGEPVLALPDRLDVNPLGAVLSALADVWDGRPDPGALAAVVAEPPPALAASLLYPARLVLRLHAGRRGLGRRTGLDRDATAGALAGLLSRPVEVPDDGDVVLEHLGQHDWRAQVQVRCTRGAVREAHVVVGVPHDEPAVPGRPEAVHRWIAGLLEVAARLGGVVEVVEAVPEDQDAPRPRGVLTADRLPAVLAAVDLPL